MANKIANKKKSSQAKKAAEKVVRHEAAVAGKTPKVTPNGVLKPGAKQQLKQDAKNGSANGKQSSAKPQTKEITITAAANLKGARPSVEFSVKRKPETSANSKASNRPTGNWQPSNEE